MSPVLGSLQLLEGRESLDLRTKETEKGPQPGRGGGRWGACRLRGGGSGTGCAPPRAGLTKGRGSLDPTKFKDLRDPMRRWAAGGATSGAGPQLRLQPTDSLGHLPTTGPNPRSIP